MRDQQPAFERPLLVARLPIAAQDPRVAQQRDPAMSYQLPDPPLLYPQRRHRPRSHRPRFGDKFSRYAVKVTWGSGLRVMFTRRGSRAAVKAYWTSLNGGQKIEATLIRLVYVLLIVAITMVLAALIVVPLIGNSGWFNS